jgi:hypothetical protein
MTTARDFYRPDRTVADARPRGMALLGWAPNDSGGIVVGRASVELPNRLCIDGITVFNKNGRRWASMPAEMLRDRDGQPLLDERGKRKYRNILRWKDKALQDGFSAALIALIEAEYGPLDEGAGS